MENNKIVPTKIHLTQIKWIKKNTVLAKKTNSATPSYDIKVAHNMMHNIDKEVVKIKLFLDVNAVVDNKVLNQGGNYELDFLFKIDDLKDHYQITNEKPLFSGLFVCTLLSISYSTLRGMLLTLWKDTPMNAVIIPVIDVTDLLKSKR